MIEQPQERESAQDLGDTIDLAICWCWKTGLSSGCVELAVKDAVADEIGVGAVAGVIGVIGVDAAACGIVGAV